MKIKKNPEMEFDITFTGVAPLMQNRYNLQTGEKKDKPKTAEAFQAMLQKQWADALYLDDEGFVCVPSEALQACIRDGAKKNRKGKDIQAGIWVTPFKPRLEIKTNGKYRCVTRDDIAGDEQFIDVRGVKVGQARVDRCRPVFSPPWRVRFRLHASLDVIGEESIRAAIDNAGRLVGLLDYRPMYGRFVAEMEEAV